MLLQQKRLQLLKAILIKTYLPLNKISLTQALNAFSTTYIHLMVIFLSTKNGTTIKVIYTWHCRPMMKTFIYNVSVFLYKMTVFWTSNNTTKKYILNNDQQRSRDLKLYVKKKNWTGSLQAWSKCIASYLIAEKSLITN